LEATLFLCHFALALEKRIRGEESVYFNIRGEGNVIQASLRGGEGNVIYSKKKLVYVIVTFNQTVNI